MNDAEKDLNYLENMLYFCEKSKSTLSKAEKFKLDKNDEIVIDALDYEYALH